MSVPVYLSLGSNISPRRYLSAALGALRAQFGELRVSPVYECRAVGFDGPNFINLVVGMDVDVPVGILLDCLRALEADNGRLRRAAKFSSRTLDIDILLYGDRVGLVDGVLLPRDDIHRYRHVIQPLADLAPDAPDPLSGRSFRAICDGLPDDDNGALWRIDDGWLG